MSYLGVSKAVLEGAGPAVENECAVRGMTTCYFRLQPIADQKGREYYLTGPMGVKVVSALGKG